METTRDAGGAQLGREALRELGRLVLESVLAGAFVSFVLGLAVFIVATQAQATPPRAGVEQGTLLLRDETGAKAAAPLLFTEVHIDVTGLTARTEVRQRFVNPTALWREGVYLFPLPEKAAVDHLDMHIGSRVIEGQIKERQAARAAYEQAKSEGRKASLVEQERPNLFTTNVAHIGPDEEIVVAIQYQEKLAYDAGSFRLRFPMAVTPRYVPAAGATQPLEVAEAGANVAADALSDAARITPKIADPAEGSINPVSLTLDIDAGFPLARISSTYHPVRVEERPGNRYHLTLANGVVPAARDFELVYTPDVGAEPGAAFFTETVNGKTYGLLVVLPPTTRDATADRPPREVTYIIDTSGSMEGVSITQAREAMLLALDRLREGDRFNVIEFNSVTHALYTAPMPVTATTLARARDFVGALYAHGGTEMKPALEAAFAPSRRDDLMRQIVFMTDGAVGNENELLSLIAQKLGDRRLFTVGIGPAPNTFFMKKAAEAGRGTFTFIGDVREVREKMTSLVRKLESPVLTDVHVDWPLAAESYPPQLPDLYAGEPVILTAAFARSALEGTVKLKGRSGGATWKAAMPLSPGAQEPGIGVLFARDKIEALADAKRNGASEEDVKRETIAIALTHHLVSAYTSLVAVDVTPTAPANADVLKTALPANLPQGLVYEAFYGGLPQTATPAALHLLVGALLLLSALAGHAAMRRRDAARLARARVAGERLGSLDALARAARRIC